MKIKKTMFLNYCLGVIPLIMVAMFYSQLPPEIPRQWQSDGGVAYMAKFFIWPLALLPLVMTMLMQFLPKIDPRRENYHTFDKQYDFMILLINVLFVAMIGIEISESLNPGTISVGKVVTMGIGALFLFIGNSMPKFKSNFFVGIKTPWTLSNKDVWNKTHRLGGILWVIGGIAMMIGALILEIKLMSVLIVAVVLILVAVPVVMSYIWFQRMGTAK